MNLVRWKRFTWDLSKLPSHEAALPSHFSVRAATPEESRSASTVIFSALSLESNWTDTQKRLQPKLEEQIEQAFEQTPVPVLVVTHGQRIIAASLLSLAEDDEVHLLSGPCVTAEYRNRGLGTALLLASLKLLQAHGLRQAYGVCKAIAPTSKFVYSKFGSTSVEYDFEATFAASR